MKEYSKHANALLLSRGPALGPPDSTSRLRTHTYIHLTRSPPSPRKIPYQQARIIVRTHTLQTVTQRMGKVFETSHSTFGIIPTHAQPDCSSNGTYFVLISALETLHRNLCHQLSASSGNQPVDAWNKYTTTH
ncbi:unnamed protein product [Ectocarpus fasciculatus]